MFTLPRNTRIAAEPLHCLVEPASAILAADRKASQIAASVQRSVREFVAERSTLLKGWQQRRES
jgi:hypothetical protein